MLTIKDLRHIELLSKSSSMAEAAARSGLTQSAISQSLSGVEEKLGVQLFVRGRNSISITRFGEAFVTRARRILNELDQLDFDIEALKNEHLGTIRFGIGPAVADLLLVEALQEFATRHPGSIPRFRTSLWEDCKTLLLDGDIDLFIGGFPRDFKDQRFTLQPFYQDRLAAIVNGQHPLCQRKRVEVADIVHYPVLAQDSRHIVLWRTLESITDLELLRLNVPASVMANPMDALPVLNTTDHVLLCARANWLKVRESHPELTELSTVDLRGAAHMYFVSLAGREPQPAQEALTAAFGSVAQDIFSKIGNPA